MGDFVNWINLSQLQSLGVGEEVFYPLIIFLGIIGCYVVIKPVTTILMSIQSEPLLRYLLCGLIFIVIFFTIVLLSGEIRLLTYQLLKFALQALAVFGVGLCVIHLFRHLVRGRKKRVN